MTSSGTVDAARADLRAMLAGPTLSPSPGVENDGARLIEPDVEVDVYSWLVWAPPMPASW